MQVCTKYQLLKRAEALNAVVVTTYGSVQRQPLNYMRVKWQYVILDEGHRIRNPNADISVVCKRLTSDHRIILTGSPVQNNLRELW